MPIGRDDHSIHWVVKVALVKIIARMSYLTSTFSPRTRI